MNWEMLKNVGVGAGWPIQLTPILTTVTKLDSDGNPVQDEKGNIIEEQVEVQSWRPLEGDPQLIKQNLISILTYEIGYRMRQEYFGCKLWSVIEEPNDDALAYMITHYIKQGISTWESRIKAVKVICQRIQGKIYIELYFKYNLSSTEVEKVSVTI